MTKTTRFFAGNFFRVEEKFDEVRIAHSMWRIFIKNFKMEFCSIKSISRRWKSRETVGILEIGTRDVWKLELHFLRMNITFVGLVCNWIPNKNMLSR